MNANVGPGAGSSARDRVKFIVQEVLDQGQDPLLACRMISGLADQLPEIELSIMDVFCGVASEVDGLPIGPERKHWNAEALAALDQRAAIYRDAVSSAVTDALRELRAVLDNSH